MKNKFSIIMLLMILAAWLSMGSLYAEKGGGDRAGGVPVVGSVEPDLTCTGAEVIDVDLGELADRARESGMDFNTLVESTIQDILDDRYSYEVSGVYKLCLNIRSGGRPAAAEVEHLIYRNEKMEKPTVISGLNLKRTEGSTLSILTVESNAKVVMINGKFEGAGRADDVGPGLALLGGAHEIYSTEVFGFSIGLFNSSVGTVIGPREEYVAAQANHIHHNQIGVYSTTAVKLPHNRIYDNANGVFSTDYAFVMAPEINDLYPRPEILRRTPPEGEAGAWGEEIALYCTFDAKGNIASQYIKFNPETVTEGQEVVVYETDVRRDHPPQMSNYLTNCVIEANEADDKVCTLDLSSYGVPEEGHCGFSNLSIVALVNESDYTSMLISGSPGYKILDGPKTTALSAGEEVEIFTSSPGVEEGGAGEPGAGEPGPDVEGGDLGGDEPVAGEPPVVVVAGPGVGGADDGAGEEADYRAENADGPAEEAPLEAPAEGGGVGNDEADEEDAGSGMTDGAGPAALGSGQEVMPTSQGGAAGAAGGCGMTIAPAGEASAAAVIIFLFGISIPMTAFATARKRKK